MRLAESFPDSSGITNGTSGLNMQEQEERLTAAFDAYAAIFSQLVEDHALLAEPPGEAMMLVHSKNTELLRTIADALVTPTLRKSRAAENFKCAIVVPAGWLHVQKVEGISGDLLPGGNWINKYRKKLELNAEDVMKIKPNFPMLMVNSLHGSQDERDWTRSNAMLDEPAAVSANEDTPPDEPFYKLDCFDDWQSSTMLQQAKVQSNLSRIKSNLEHLKRGGLFQRDGRGQGQVCEEDFRGRHVASKYVRQ
ncbi:hypothetical protein HDU88_003573 [Geranomyces variabilis]|nr:hypothetical protein HDU88_003573 [Geranomyces variabilis]